MNQEAILPKISAVALAGEVRAALPPPRCVAIAWTSSVLALGARPVSRANTSTVHTRAMAAARLVLTLPQLTSHAPPTLFAVARCSGYIANAMVGARQWAWVHRTIGAGPALIAHAAGATVAHSVSTAVARAQPNRTIRSVVPDIALTLSGAGVTLAVVRATVWANRPGAGGAGGVSVVTHAHAFYAPLMVTTLLHALQISAICARVREHTNTPVLRIAKSVSRTTVGTCL